MKGFPVPIFATLGSLWSFAFEVVYGVLTEYLSLPILGLGLQGFVCFSQSEKQEEKVSGRSNSLFKGIRA